MSEPLTNGLLELDRSADLTKLESWEVEFRTYTHTSQKPIVVMAPGSSLDEIERVARQAMTDIVGSRFEMFESAKPNLDETARAVAQLAVQSVRRVGSIYLDPRIG